MAKLIVSRGDETRTVELDSGEATRIGRDASNQIALGDERKASRRHCQVTPIRSNGNERWEVVDLGATNKTRVNGKPIDRKVLTSGDVIQVGAVEIRFEDPDEEARIREAGSRGVCMLVWAAGDRKGDTVLLESPRVTIGRRESNTIPIDDRMASGHHAEVTKDINGYTVRDLGSTNGTLVNGEPITEAPLTHGSRLRVGNSRFVFKDPSMKDVEVELAAIEDDEGWGMMGDIDLSRARGSYTGLLVALVILALAGVGGWWISTQDTGTGTIRGRTEANLVEGGDFEGETAGAGSWNASDVILGDAEGVVSVRGGALRVEHPVDPETDPDAEAGPLLVVYGEPFEALRGRPFRLTARVRTSGEGDGGLVVRWLARRRGGALTHSRRLGSDGAIDVLLPKPLWADALLLAVRVAPGQSVTLDDVRLVREREEADLVRMDVPGDVDVAVEPSGGSLDVVDAIDSPILVGAVPVVRVGETVFDRFEPDGPPEAGVDGVVVEGTFATADPEVDARPGRVAWGVLPGEGLRVEIASEGADAVGLRADFPVEQVGEVVSVLTAAGARTVPATAGERAEGVRKALTGTEEAGARGTSVIAFRAPEGRSDVVLEVGQPIDEQAVRLVFWLPGTPDVLEIVTSHEAQAQAAGTALAEARRLLRERPGEGIERLRSVAKEYPFETEVRRQAEALADEAEKAALADIERMEDALERFDVYRSRDALEALEALAETLTARFPAREDGGSIEKRVEELVRLSDTSRAKFYEEFAGEELARLQRLADLLEATEGYRPMAVLYLRVIQRRWGDLAGTDTPFGRRVRAAREQLDRLLEREDVAAAVPPEPQ